MKRRIERTVNRILTRAGWEIGDVDELEKRAFARHLELLFKDLGVQCVLDVGAHLGEYRNFLRERVGYDGLIISFEPVRRSVEALNVLARNDPQWVVCGFALGSQTGMRPINVARFDGLSSFLEPERRAPDEFKEVIARDYRETVEIRTLDTAIELLEREHPSLGLVAMRGTLFLKMDTQGFNLQVIEGGRETISHVVALQTELSIQRLYSRMPEYKDELAVLEKMGFCISGMYPVARDKLRRVIEFDCVMVLHHASDRRQNPRQSSDDTIRHDRQA